MPSVFHNQFYQTGYYRYIDRDVTGGWQAVTTAGFDNVITNYNNSVVNMYYQSGQCNPFIGCQQSDLRSTTAASRYSLTFRCTSPNHLLTPGTQLSFNTVCQAYCLGSDSASIGYLQSNNNIQVSLTYVC